MTLSILNTLIDEEYRATQTGTADDNDVTTATFNASSVATAVGNLSLTFASGHTGFPQFAEKTSFVSSSNQVTDYFLSGAGGAAINGTATDLFVGSDRVFLYATSDSNVVVGRIGTGAIANASGNVALVIALDETKAGGLVTSANMWLGLYAPLVHDGQNLVDSADTLDLSGLIYLGSNFNTATEVPFSDFSKVPSGNPDFNVIFPTGTNTDLQLLVTGVQGETQKTVNISTTGIGAGSQTTTVGTSIRIDTVKGFVQDNVDSNNELVPSAIQYNQHVNVVDGSFQITQTNPNKHLVDVNVSAFNVQGDAKQQAFLTDAIATDGTPVQIDAADVQILNAAGADITASFGGTITQVGDTVKITNLAKGMQVKFTTDGVQFDRMLINNADSNDTFDVGNIKVTTLVGGSDTEYRELGSHLIYEDDGPNIDPSGNTPATLTAHDSDLVTNPQASFSGLFTAPDYGADGPGSVSYLLSVKSANVDSGIDDTLTGQNVLLTYDAATNTVYGKTASSGATVFVITVNSSGQVTLDQQRAVEHANTSSTSETTTLIAADLISLTAKIVDSEATGTNDSDTAKVDIGTSFVFTDDGPTITGQPGGSLTPNDLQVPNVVNSQASSQYFLSGGGDGANGFNFINPDSTGDFTWSYFDVNGDSTTGHNEIKGFYKGTALYTAVLNSDGTYTFKMIGALPGSTDSLDTHDIKAGAPDTFSIRVGTLSNDNYVLLEGQSTLPKGEGHINESHAFVGVDNGNFDVGESLVFSLHEAIGAGQTEGDLIPFQGFVIGTKSASDADYHWEATLVGGGTIEGDAHVLKGQVITIDPAGDAPIESITLTKESGNALKIGLGDIQIIKLPADVNLNFDVQLKDGDLDSAGASFTVSIDGNNDGSYDATAISSAVINPSASGPAPTTHTAHTFDHSSLGSFDQTHHQFHADNLFG